MADHFRVDRANAEVFLHSPELLAAVKEHFGDAILNDAQRIVPVDTGHLRDSGYSKVEGDHVEVGFTAEYGGYVELGTEHMRASPYLRPAAYQDRGRKG